nr:MAG TPA: hypothetical protein [Caudoviricetes sp.]
MILKDFVVLVVNLYYLKRVVSSLILKRHGELNSLL